MTRAAFIAVPLLFAISAFATAQNADTLMVGSQKRDVYGIELPQNVLARLDAWKKKHNEEGVASANWKGFYATLRLANKQLLLERRQRRWRGSIDVPVSMRFLFGVEPPIRAVWFSGQLTEYHSAPGLRSIRPELSSNMRRCYTFRDGKVVSVRTEPVPR